MSIKEDVLHVPATSNLAYQAPPATIIIIGHLVY
jgi:hypothetical protein